MLADDRCGARHRRERKKRGKKGTGKAAHLYFNYPEEGRKGRKREFTYPIWVTLMGRKK